MGKERKKEQKREEGVGLRGGEEKGDL